jgi:hypothetical protein
MPTKIPPKPAGLSLHIGLNSVDPKGYGGWSGPLNACENDARDMAAIAAKQGYKSKILLTKEATSTAVTTFLRNAAKTLKKGDELFISYSGHGGQVPDDNGDEKGAVNSDDKVDETWCLFDRQLVDDELWALWSNFATGVRIIMLSDSCHSGTVAKDMISVLSGSPRIPIRNAATIDFSAFRVKALPPDELRPAYNAKKRTYDRIQKELATTSKVKIGASVVLISGCQDNQTSLDGQKNGLFTEKLLQVYNGGKFTGSLKSFHSAILNLMPFTQSPNYFVVGAKNAKFESTAPFRL